VTEENDCHGRLKDMAGRIMDAVRYQVRWAAFVFAENFKISARKYKKWPMIDYFLKGNRDFSLRNPEGLLNMRTKVIDTNVIEEFFCLIREIAEELEIE
jgi:hypothetical protein